MLPVSIWFSRGQWMEAFMAGVCVLAKGLVVKAEKMIVSEDRLLISKGLPSK